MSTLSTLFVKAAKLSGIRDIEIARQAKVSRAALSKIRDGTTKGLKADKALRIVDILHATAQWLADRTGPMTPMLTDAQDKEAPARAKGMIPVQSTLTAFLMDFAHTIPDEKCKAILILLKASAAEGQSKSFEQGVSWNKVKFQI